MLLKIGIIIKNHLPKPIFNFLSKYCGYLPQDILWGKGFRDWYLFLKDTESWSQDKIEEYQWEQLKEILKNAYNCSPYYQKKFDANNIALEQIHSIKDFQKLPFLTKELVKLHYDEIISINAHSGEYLIDYTGGSTSEPMKFVVDSQQIPKELAFFKYVWEKSGYILGDKCVEFKGAKVSDPQKKIFWKYDPILNLLKMDSDYLNDMRYSKYYINKISEFNSNYIFGFPSSIYLFAKQVEKSFEKKIPPVKLIMLASENVYEWQINYIKKVFDCDEVFFHYGHSEKGALAVKCLKSNVLHFLPQYGYTELINQDGNPAKPGEVGEIVVTSFCKSFPLIRYRTKDYAVMTNANCNCIWGNYLTVSHIEGRLQEYVVTKDKRLVSICTLGGAHFTDMYKVLSTQYYQKEPGKIILNILPFPDQTISKDTCNNIKTALENKLEQSVEVEVKIVSELTQSPSGKKSMIIQKLDINQFINGTDNL